MIVSRIKFVTEQKNCKMKKIVTLVLACICISVVSYSQKLREIPEQVKYAFSKQYPDAQQVEYKDMLTSVQVNFVQNGETIMATYSNKGSWKESVKAIDYDKVPQAIKDGFDKSKYADDWKVDEAAIFSTPGGSDSYRLKVSKNDLQKKYLYFNKSGRLVRDAITI